MTPLGRELRRLILREGPIPLSLFMAEALGHPRHGYYRTRDPLGVSGDFTTAPEISQMFGELIGLWAADLWSRLGAPDPVLLVELGPGRGTLMSDALRAARVVPAFRAATRLHLVETSPALRRRQAESLADWAPTFHETVGEIPDGPLILVANEVFDALPVRQLVRTAEGWRERMVGLDPAGERFVFALSPEPDPAAMALLPPELQGRARQGDVFEWSPQSTAIISEIGARLATAPGGALVIDYGHAAHALGDSVQAVRRHGYADPLVDPGETDLTAHVDFAALAAAVTAAGALAWGPVDQGLFLIRLGIDARAARLAASGDPADIEAARSRLVEAGAMGTLFKALAVTSTGLGPPAGFAADGGL